MKSQRGNVTILIVILVLMALLAVGWLFTNRTVHAPSVTPADETALVNNPAESPCGLSISSPLPGDSVSMPFTIVGSINTSSSLSCRWILFEGQAGTVEIRNSTTNAVVLNQTPVMLTQMDWMDRAIAGQPVDFAIPIVSLDVAYTGLATILFVEEDPSGESVQDTLMLNVTIQ